MRCSKGNSSSPSSSSAKTRRPPRPSFPLELSREHFVSPSRRSIDSPGGALSHSRRRRANRSSASSRKSSPITTTSLTPSSPRPKPSRQIVEERDSVDGIIAAVEAGSGVALCRQSASRMFSVGRIKLLRLIPEPKTIDIGLAARKGSA